MADNIVVRLVESGRIDASINDPQPIIAVFGGGARGLSGTGLPLGGEVGQIIKKRSSIDQDVEWSALRLSDAEDDSTHRLVTDSEMAEWSGKQDALTPDTDYLTPGTAATTYEPKKGTDDNFMTDAEKLKLSGIAEGAEANVNADWNATSGDAQILNKPTLGTAAAENVGAFAPALGTDDNYVTDAEKVKLSNLSGTNTGDQVIPDQLSDLSEDTTHRTVTDTEKSTWNGKQNALGFTPENSANKGTSGGYAELDVTGKVPSTQLPSYVDDVIETANYAALVLIAGETGKIYITLDDGKTYRWSGSAYAEISASLALGETSGTAYRGDRGKTAYDHSQASGNPHGTTYSDVGAAPALGTDDNYVTDAEKTKLSNLSGTNTGDQDLSGLVVKSGSLTQLTTRSHADLQNLTADDHSQYALLAGRSGGQTIIGGTGVTDKIVLQGTSGNGTAASPALQVNVGNNGATTALTVLNNGNVGIGTTSPTAKLHLNGTLGALSGGLAFGDGDTGFYESSDDVLRLQTLGTDRVTVLGNGNVGIGTGNPLSKLHVYGPDGTEGTVQLGAYASVGAEYGSGAVILGANVKPKVGSAGMQYTATNAVGGGQAIYMKYSSGITFHTLAGSVVGGDTYSSERMRINTDGNVGIGTTSPGDKLTVSGGNIAINGSYVIKQSDSNTPLYLQTTGAQPIIFRTSSSSEKVRITDDGNVGIGTTSPTARIHVRGAGTTSSTVGLLVGDSSGTANLTIRDDGAFAFRGGTVGLADSGWSVANKTESRTLDCDLVSIDGLADIVGTILDALKLKGIITS